MTPPAQAEQLSQATAQRLRSCLQTLGRGDLEPADDVAAFAAALQDEPDSRVLWLALVAITGRFPTGDEVIDTRRQLELMTGIETEQWLRENLDAAADAEDGCENTIEILTGEVLVETDFSARKNLHTGIQRVVRTTLPLWAKTRSITPVVWSEQYAGLRRLDDHEQVRLLAWGTHGPEAVPGEPRAEHLLVPWQCVLVLAEVPAQLACPRLAALAQHSGTRLVGIGYDCIPIVSADLVPREEPNRFVQYLHVVKHTRRIAAISVSATAEFTGFADMLGAQGLAGPHVIECALPVQTLDASTASSQAPGDDLPTVLCVGSIEPRKNQLAVLAVAEALWRDGVRFQLRFIGGGTSSNGRRLILRARELRAAGRPVSVDTDVSEQALITAFRRAHCTVFVSLHEGYGLPVAESLAYGVPVVASNFGSVCEIGQDGGVEFVDPREDADIERGLRRLLTDPQRHAELVQQIVRRPRRDWNDYADELWQLLIEPELAELPGQGATAR